MSRCSQLLIAAVAFILIASPISFAQEANDSLPTLNIPNEGQDEEPLFRALHGAELLAESGAGYEAARVLGALATQAKHHEPGREATQLLRELDISVEDIRDANRKEIEAKVAAAIRRHNNDDQRENHDVRHMHVRNMVELKQFSTAANFMLDADQKRSRDQVAEHWSDVLHRFQIQAEWLTEKSGANIERIVTALEQARARDDLQRNVHTLWAVDHEAAELGRWLLEYSNRSGDDEHHEDWEDEHDNQYAKWVESRREREEEERRHEEEEEEDEDDEEDQGEDDHDELEHISAAALGRAHKIARRDPKAARVLGKLIVVANPDSLVAESATAMLKRLNVPKTEAKQPLRKTDDDNDPAAAVFAERRIRDYGLTLTEDAIKKLHDNPKEYVRATFREGKQEFKNVGVRLKGGWGSFRMIDGRQKAAFTVKFNQFDREQRFHGLRRIVLNNGAQDASYLHEYVGYELFRAAGVPAPRITHARLAVNGESYGLYVQVEAVTKDFLGRWFSETKGNLYEGPGDVMNWRELDIDSNQEKDDRSDLKRLAEAIEHADEDDPWANLSKFVDIDSFARFIAMEQMVGHWDGYMQTNNYRIYNDPGTGKFHFFPHGCDQLFEEVDHNIFHDQGGILGRALLKTDSGRAKYRQALQQILDEVWHEDQIREHIAEAYVLIRGDVMTRGKSEHGADEFEHHTRRMLRFVALRRMAVESQLRRGEPNRSWRERQDDEHHLPSIFHHDEEDW